VYCVRHLTLGLLNNIICQGSTGAMGEAGRIGNPGIDGRPGIPGAPGRRGEQVCK